VALGGEPTVVRYNASVPIVVYTPRDLQVRWRLWKAETSQQQAQQR
jgi:ecotin